MRDRRILIAEDDKEIAGLIKKYLEVEGYLVDTANQGEEALRLCDMHQYILCILDIMMPKKDGMEVCKHIRRKSNIPIIMLTAKGDEIDKIMGLSIGADDYITKPFNIHELVARVKSHLRRFLELGSDASQKEDIRKFGSIKIDTQSYEVYKKDKLISLTTKEYEILKFLSSNPNRVYTKKQIFDNVWGADYMEDDNTVMVHIRRLRKKIEDNPDDPKNILTVWGIGYKFIGD